jgi:hypothetical protein
MFACAVGLSAVAHAGTITTTFNVTSGTFAPEFVWEPNAPVDPVIGSFTITYDPTVSVTNQLTGPGSININVSSALVFSYDSTFHELFIGGAVAGAAAIAVGTNDFGLEINSPETAPSLFHLFYSQAGYPGLVWTTLSGNVSVSPEPASLVLFAGGSLLVAAIRRNRLKSN